MFSLMCTWTNGWANSPDAGDLRRHWAHYDVAVKQHWWNGLSESPDYITLPWHGLAQRAHDVIITSLLRQNDVTTSFWRKNDVTITSCVRWVRAQIRIGHNPTNTQRNKHVIVTSKHRFDVIITRLLRCVFAGMRSQRKAAYSEGTESVSHTPILSYVSQSKKYEAI